MPERSVISQGVQIGVEAVEGTAVPANKLLSTLAFTPRPNFEFSTFRPPFSKFPTTTTLLREWSAVGLDGVPTYTEIVYALAMIFGTPTITTPAGFVNARQWEFEIAPMSDDPPKTLTVEKGDSSLAERVAGVVLNGLTMGFSRTAEPTLTGEGFGRFYTPNIAKTASPTAVPVVPILPKQVCVYIDLASATPETTFGTTKMTRLYTTTLALSNRFSNFWALDCAQDSYVATMETALTSTFAWGMMADSTGMGLLANARAGDTLLVRVEATGDEIDEGVAESAYRLTLDMAVQISEVADMGDQDGAVVLPYTGNLVYDPTWGKAIRVQVVNELTAL